MEYRLKQLEEKIRESEQSIRSLKKLGNVKMNKGLEKPIDKIERAERSRADWSQTEESKARNASEWVFFAPAVLVCVLLICLVIFNLYLEIEKNLQTYTKLIGTA